MGQVPLHPIPIAKEGFHKPVPPERCGTIFHQAHLTKGSVCLALCLALQESVSTDSRSGWAVSPAAFLPDWMQFATKRELREEVRDLKRWMITGFIFLALLSDQATHLLEWILKAI